MEPAEQVEPLRIVLVYLKITGMTVNLHWPVCTGSSSCCSRLFAVVLNLANGPACLNRLRLIPVSVSFPPTWVLTDRVLHSLAVIFTFYKQPAHFILGLFVFWQVLNSELQSGDIYLENKTNEKE